MDNDISQMNIMETFFTSDTHFYHKNIIELCKRPYRDIEQMHEEMVNSWNSVVSPSDTVYHLGDVAFSRELGILHRLNGFKHLIYGNHDEMSISSLAPYFIDIQRYKELKLGNQKLVLFHFPIEDWNGKMHGTIHLHGHSHGRAVEAPNRMDVGWDAKWTQYRPVNLQDILARKAQLPPLRY